MILMRKISGISKWDGTNEVHRCDQFICGDALGDLKTTQNALSVWKADDETDIEDAVVALALSRDKVDKIYGVNLDSDILNGKGIVFEENPGEAPEMKKEILDKHRDLVELDYWRVGYLAEYMTNLVKENGPQIRFSAKNVRNLMEKYKEEDKINLDEMKPKLKKDLKWA